MTTRTVLVAIGGASCCGKTTLAKHLVRILPSSSTILLHQDDYAPPEDQIPVHPIHGVKDWDAPATAIEWSSFHRDLQKFKDGLDVELSDKSYIHTDLLLPVPIPDATTSSWRSRFSSYHSTRFVLVDGFLLYWDRSISSLYDVRLLIRSDKSTLEKRRSDRNERISDDSFWKDPPGIFDKVVWPAYVEAHKGVFEHGNVEQDAIKTNSGITLIEESKLQMEAIVEKACQTILDQIS